MDGRNYFLGNCAVGELTNRGYQQEYNVGQMYRRQYVDSGLLPPIHPEMIYLRSDEDSR